MACQSYRCPRLRRLHSVPLWRRGRHGRRLLLQFPHRGHQSHRLLGRREKSREVLCPTQPTLSTLRTWTAADCPKQCPPHGGDTMVDPHVKGEKPTTRPINSCLCLPTNPCGLDNPKGAPKRLTREAPSSALGRGHRPKVARVHRGVEGQWCGWREGQWVALP